MPIEVSLPELLHQFRRQPYGILLCSSHYPGEDLPQEYETLGWIGGVSSSAFINHWPKVGENQLGFISYDYKNVLHGLHNQFPSLMDWPLLGWISPEWFAKGSQSEWSINDERRSLWKSGRQPIFIPQFNQKEYLKKVETVRELIRIGTVYELNLCQAFSTQDLPDDPIELFFAIRSKKPVSFSALMKWEHRWMLCFSPERFIKKQGNQLLSQPIKGTIARKVDRVADQLAANNLACSEKDRAENVMIVDLVRNDLARICKTGSVSVPDLLKVYSFPTVHQMISSVIGTLKPEVDFQSIIQSCFPMGSMTGAPKREAMIQIDHLEGFSRNLFSGSIGYVNEEGDFDLNVIIRSLFIDEQIGKTSCFAGGAITYQSDPISEYHECLLKVAPLIEMAGGILHCP